MRRALALSAAVLAVPAAAQAGAPDPQALRAEGVRVQWPLQGETASVAPGALLVVRVRSARRPVRVALLRVTRTAQPMRVVRARRMRRGTFSVRVPEPAGPTYQLSLAVGSERWWTTVVAERCPGAGGSEPYVRLDRTVLRREEIFGVEVVNTRDTHHLSGGWDFWYERLREDGAWERVGADYPFPRIAVAAPPCGSFRHDARVDPELQPGRHRLVKPLSGPHGPFTLSAEFDVAP